MDNNKNIKNAPANKSGTQDLKITSRAQDIPQERPRKDGPGGS